MGEEWVAHGQHIHDDKGAIVVVCMWGGDFECRRALAAQIADDHNAVGALLAACKQALTVAESGDYWWIDCPDRGGLDSEGLAAAIAATGAVNGVEVKEPIDDK